MSLTKCFADRFSQFLRENYADVAEVERVYGVSRQRAHNWWNGYSNPNGPAVVKFSDRHGQAFIDFMKEVS